MVIEPLRRRLGGADMEAGRALPARPFNAPCWRREPLPWRVIEPLRRRLGGADMEAGRALPVRPFNAPCWRRELLPWRVIEPLRSARMEPGKIRNVAIVGHRGTGKTSLLEAMLFQAGAINRLGTVEAGTTVGDWDEDEQRRQMSLAASLAHLEWQGRKINLIDTPGDSGFQADTITSLRVVEGALVVVSAVMGVEVNTLRVWARSEELALSRVVFVNMLDRERADFFRTLGALQEQLSDRCVAIELPIGAEHELTGIVDLLHNCAYMDPAGAREGDPVPIPDSMADQAAEYREKLLDAVVETDEELMERYLGGEELDPEAVAAALKTAVTND